MAWVSRDLPPAIQGRGPADSGFSIIELLVVTAVVLSVLAGVSSLVGGSQLGLGVETERADEQQRLRVAVETLSSALATAGAGVRFAIDGRPIGLSVASVFPYRQGAQAPDAPGTVRTDAITVLALAGLTGPHTTVREAIVARSGTATIDLDGCAHAAAACGFSPGTDVAVYDDTGAYDTFRVATIHSDVVELQHTMPDTAHVYAAGSRIAAAASRTFSLKTDRETDTSQLVRYDGVASVAAIADHVVGLAFEYYGDPSPPVLLPAATEGGAARTSYGPRPPPAGARLTAYPAGENCAFQLDAAGRQVSRLPELNPGSPGLVRLSESSLGDGPWCPDAANPHRYDADLLRVRRVSVTVRVESALSALRGPAGLLFARPGTSRQANHWVPDQEVRFDVTPRNLDTEGVR